MREIKELKTILENDDLILLFKIDTEISLLLAGLFINKFSINLEKIYFASLRFDDSYCFKSSYKYKRKSSFFSKLYSKIISQDLHGLQVRNWIENYKKDFILVVPWMSPSSTIVSQSIFCKGIFHIEEGSQTYQKVNEYNPNFINNKDRLKSHRNGIGKDVYWTNKSLFYLCMFESSFPLINPKKKIVLGEKKKIQEIYEPKLVDYDHIGLMPTPQRLNLENYIIALKKLIRLMPSKAKIKLHPATYLNKKLLKRILIELNKMQIDKKIIIDHGVILEAEMLYSKKKLYGSGSSLSIYSEYFKSIYNKIEFDGYIPPNYKHL